MSILQDKITCPCCKLEFGVIPDWGGYCPNCRAEYDWNNTNRDSNGILIPVWEKGLDVEKLLASYTGEETLSDSKDGCIITYTGIYIDILNPTPEMINIEDIAQALSNQCRFGGHISTFMSVAQHSLNCSYLMPNNSKKLDCLMHDASEAYLQDIQRPVKSVLSNYKEIEDRLMHVIATKFGFQYPLDPEVNKIDKIMLAAEWDNLILRKNPSALPNHDSYQTKSTFLNCFKYYSGLKNII